ncbi:hypothetical protein E0504_45755 [Parafrankia sp. BMG5.11]|nr:hypothetical protein E0504_45755 [Parafrankia sp. BMG5.11]
MSFHSTGGGGPSARPPGARRPVPARLRRACGTTALPPPGRRPDPGCHPVPSGATVRPRHPTGRGRLISAHV